VVSKCMTALSSRCEHMTSEESPITEVIRSVECLVRVEAFDVELDNSTMELIKYFTTCRSGKK